MAVDRITILSGPEQGTSIEIVESLSIGRSPENGLQLNDLQVSRHHAVIQRSSQGTVIRDLSSGNGTYIGDRRIIEYRLSDGDIIHIGPMQLRFTSADPPQPVQVDTASGVLIAPQDESTLEASAVDNVYQTFFHAPRAEASAEQLQAAQERLAAVYEANQIISSERDLGRLFERVMDQIFALVPAHNGVILIKDKKTGEPVTEYTKFGPGQSQVTISSSIVQRAFVNGEAVLTSNAADDSRFGAHLSIISCNIASAMCAPLTYQNERLGVLYVDTRGTTNAFDKSDLELLVALSGPAAIAIRNAQFVSELEHAYHDTLLVLASAIEMRDHYTVGHTWRVTNFAVAMGRMLGWSEEELKRCEMGGVLHDVGKIAVEDAILRKPERLTQEEFEKMRIHPERGARMMQDCKALVPLIPYVLYHHERYDGKGYPYGLKGEEIPIEGRLLAVADTFDAMTSNRPYRKGLPAEVAIAELEKGKGTQFDAACVDALVQCYRQGMLDTILQEFSKGERSIACPFCSTYVKIPDDVDVGGRFECGVCHRIILLRRSNDVYHGDVVAAMEYAAPTPVINRTPGQ
ncbi:MAG: HD domain-containing protein [FCB group bacterium]|jgi:HD-GYP domain-containing protein (c-di-GMP phosphodiesterase class II)|nr:HD domain-containing protein [FCB group bacterium]